MVKTSKAQMQNESIWNNKFITSGGHSIKDLISNVGTFMTMEEIEVVHGIHCSFLHILQVRSAIPWLSLMTLQKVENYPTRLCVGEGDSTRSIYINCESSKNIYRIMANHK